MSYSLPVAGSGSVAVIDGQTTTLSYLRAAPAAPVLTVVGQAYTANVSGSDTAYVFGPGRTLSAGGAVTVAGTTYGLPASGSEPVVVINGQSSTFTAGASTVPSLDFTIGDDIYTATTAGSSVVYVGGSGSTLTLGGATATDGTTYSLPASASGSAIVINGQTSTIAPGYVTPAPVLTIGDDVYPATRMGSSIAYDLGSGTTLTPGGAITTDGTTYSLLASASGTVVVVDGQTSTLSSAPAMTMAPVLTLNDYTYTASLSGSSTAFVLGAGEILTPGGVVTAGSTRISWGPGSTQVVVGSKTETLGLVTVTGTEGGVGGYVATGLGVEPFTGAGTNMYGYPAKAACALVGVAWAMLVIT